MTDRARTRLGVRWLIGLSFAVPVFVLFGASVLRRHSLERQQQVIEAIESAGGDVYFEWEFDTNGVRIIDAQPPLAKGWQALFGFEERPSVVKVEFPKAADDELLLRLRYLPDIRELNLAYCFNISDDGMAVIRELPCLEELKVYRNEPVRGNNFTRGALLTGQPRLTDLSLQYIAECTSIRWLSVNDNPFSDNGARHLKRMSSLEFLNISHTRVSSEMVSELSSSLTTCQILDTASK